MKVRRHKMKSRRDFYMEKGSRVHGFMVRASTIIDSLTKSSLFSMWGNPLFIYPKLAGIAMMISARIMNLVT